VSQRVRCGTKHISRDGIVARTKSSCSSFRVSLSSVSGSLSLLQARHWQAHPRGASNRRGVLPTSTRCAHETAEPAEDHALSLRRASSTRGTHGRNWGLRHCLQTPIQILAVSCPKPVWMGFRGPSIPIQGPIHSLSKSRLDGQSSGLDDPSTRILDGFRWGLETPIDAPFRWIFDGPSMTVRRGSPLRISPPMIRRL